MWAKSRRKMTADAQSLLAKAQARGWKNDGERDSLLDQIAGLKGLEVGDVAWLAVDQDPALRERSQDLFARWPYEEVTASLMPFLVSRTETVRRLAIEALASRSGSSFSENLPDLLKHREPTVVSTALDWLRHNPSERNLTLAAVALNSSSPGVRRKAFSIVEATSSAKVLPFALKGLEDEDEDLRYRSIQLLARFPEEGAIGPLLKHCHLDSRRIQDAAIAALSPLLAHADIRWNEDLIPLLSDPNPRVRQLASRILKTQDPARVAEAFLHAYQDVYGPARDRALEGLRELGPNYIPAFLERDNDPDHRIAALASAVAVTIRSPEVVPHCIRYLQGKTGGSATAPRTLWASSATNAASSRS